jgi:hypothetical protein
MPETVIAANAAPDPIVIVPPVDPKTHAQPPSQSAKSVRKLARKGILK